MNIEEEKNYLKKLKEKLIEEIEEVANRVENRSKEFRESMRYLAENRNSMDGMEIFSNRQMIERLVDSGEFTLQQLDKLKKLMDSPYFARIDFLLGEDEDPLKVYIGRFSFVDDDHNTWVYDWRAPISSMYYDYELGDASYESPSGTVEGRITVKRQYKITKGNLEFAIESAMAIGDEVLQRELSSTSDQKMKNIVATIQREQNKIIRNEESEVLVIQGVAGSGKTSIALHRVAFFLYRYKEKIAAENILILSPNKVFADYISGVLPELGEQPISELGMEDIARNLLPDELGFEKTHELVERLMESVDEMLGERVQYKSTLEFLHQINNYLDYVDQQGHAG